MHARGGGKEGGRRGPAAPLLHRQRVSDGLSALSCHPSMATGGDPCCPDACQGQAQPTGAPRPRGPELPHTSHEGCARHTRGGGGGMGPWPDTEAALTMSSQARGRAHLVQDRDLPVDVVGVAAAGRGDEGGHVPGAVGAWAGGWVGGCHRPTPWARQMLHVTSSTLPSSTLPAFTLPSSTISVPRAGTGLVPGPVRQHSRAGALPA